MSRTTKNVLMSVVLVILIAFTALTIYFAKSDVKTSNNGPSIENNANTTPPSMNNNENNSNNSNNQPPEMNNNNNNNSNNQPPEMNNNENNNDSNNESSENKNNQPPEKPDGEGNNTNSNSQNNNTPPSPPSGGNNQDMPNNNGGGMPNMTVNSNISILFYILFGVEGLLIGLIVMYLIISKFNKKSFKETFKDTDKIIILILGTIIITSGVTALDSVITKSISDNKVSITKGSSNASGSVIVKSKKKLTGTYTATDSDESGILVSSGGSATIDGATINKKSGDSSSTSNSEFTGVNSGVLVQNNGTATIKNATIKTSAKGANAVFATGENAKIKISDTKITTTGESSSRGLDATYGGTIEADNVDITTQGGSCATLATDRGEGTVTVKNSKLETNGSGSPVIYSTGNISIKKTKGNANNSQMVVIEGKNSATITKSSLTASASPNRGDVDQAGVMIYQSMSGDASEGVGTFTATDSTLTINKDSKYYKTAPMFFITNTDAAINLTNTKLSFGTNVLISAKGTSEWGNSSSNGGNLTLNAKNQELKGNIEIDKISTLDLTLSNSSTYEGTINKDNSAKEIKITLSKDSTLTLSGDSYISSLEDEDETYSNINFNGYTLYVNGVAIK